MPRPRLAFSTSDRLTISPFLTLDVSYSYSNGTWARTADGHLRRGSCCERCILFSTYLIIPHDACPPKTAISGKLSSKKTLDTSVRIKGTTLGFDERIRRRNYLSQLTVSSFDKKELNTMIAAEPLQHARLTYLAKLRLARSSTEIPGMFTLVANESTKI